MMTDITDNYVYVSQYQIFAMRKIIIYQQLTKHTLPPTTPTCPCPLLLRNPTVLHLNLGILVINHARIPPDPRLVSIPPLPH